MVWKIFSQIFFGAGAGLVIATGAVFLLHRISFHNNGFDLLLFISIALLSYSLPDLIGGNGYLSAYIVGIVLGNTEFPERKPLVSFFDAITSLMQIVIFFLLGMLAIPSNLLHSLLPALLVFLFLTLVARPLAVCSVLTPFKKYPFKQLELISFVGLRGAASIVFAITILTSGAALKNDIFSIVFCIVLLSIALQGSLIPSVARSTGMTDTDEDVMTTFSDFCENAEMSFGAIRIKESSSWAGHRVSEYPNNDKSLLVMIQRDNERVIPNGNTILKEGDVLVLLKRNS